MYLCNYNLMMLLLLIVWQIADGNLPSFKKIIAV